MEQVVNPWAMLAYLIAGVCFILALSGLSSPASSRRGNRFGMFGMLLAVVTTLLIYLPMIGSAQDGAPDTPGGGFASNHPDLRLLGQVLAAIAIGDTIGIVTAR